MDTIRLRDVVIDPRAFGRGEVATVRRIDGGRARLGHGPHIWGAPLADLHVVSRNRAAFWPASRWFASVRASGVPS